MPFLILQGYISKAKTDAVVNSADPSLLGGGAVADCLHKAAGRKLKRACAALNSCAVGDAQATEAFKLPCKYIIHTVGPVWKGGLESEEALLASCYRRSLQLAIELGCRSVAFPLISAGANGFPHELALRVAGETIAGVLKERELDVYLLFLDRLTVFQCDFRYYDGVYCCVKFWSAFKVIIPYYAELYAFVQKSLFDNALFSSIADERYYSWRNDRDLDYLDGPGSTIWYENIAYSSRNEEAADVKEWHSAHWGEQYDWLGEALKHFPALLNYAAPYFDESSSPEETCGQMLRRLMRLKGLSCEQCARKANISSKYLQSLLSYADSSPSKNTAAALAVALELSIAETSDMMAKLGVVWLRCDLFEAIVEFYISKGMYDVHRVNMALFAYKQRLLGIDALYSADCPKRGENGDIRQDFDGYYREWLSNYRYSSKIYIDFNNAKSKYENHEMAVYSDDGKTLLRADERCLSVTIPAGVAFIERGAFQDCRRLSSVSIPDSVVRIGHHAFSRCSALVSVRLPAQLTSVNVYLFAGCQSLKEVELPVALTDICAGAFFNCFRLSSVKLPFGIKSIGSDAFWNCRKLEKINLPSSIDYIGDHAFYCCQSLRDIVLPSGLTEIKAEAFMKCASLISVTLPAGVHNIGASAFCECSSLVSVNIAAEIKENEVAELGASAGINSLLSAGRIEQFAFGYCKSLTSVQLPAGIAVIDSWAFAFCESLRDISIPDTVTKIKSGAFQGCVSLRALVIPDSVREIASYAFDGVPCVIYSGTAEGAPWGAGKVLTQSDH